MFGFFQPVVNLGLRPTLLLFFGAAICVFWGSGCQETNTVDFSRDVKPILNNKCLSCHGGVRKQGGFSLLFEHEAFAQLESGKYGIVRGKPGQSEMIHRIKSKDPDERMPHEMDPLTDEEVEVLTRWVRQGAKWGKHWAYEPVINYPPPNVEDSWISNDIDRFVMDPLNDISLRPSAIASPGTLTRRVGLDIIGMPPERDMVAFFLNDPSPENYSILVDSLLESDAFGEKWASMWLDVARYADTKGYERDDHRDIWQYRDWLIRAFNEDLPYDDFIIHQLAGDMLENPTDDLYLATAFHRNSMTNDEGGTDNEEFRTAAVIDRVNTTWESFMGTSFACVQCHSHPYDPFTHEEYYEMLAFFNNTRDEDTYADYPLLRHYSTEQRAYVQDVEQWLDREVSQGEKEDIVRFIKTLVPARNSLTTDQFVNAELADTKWLSMRQNASARLSNVLMDGRTKLLMRYVVQKGGGELKIVLDSVGGPLLTVLPISKDHQSKGWEYIELNITPVSGTHDVYFLYSNPYLETPDTKGIMFDWFYFTKPFPGMEKEGYDDIKEKFWALITEPVETTPIMVENDPDLRRKTHLFERGSWLVHGKEVSPAVPSSLHPMEEDLSSDRLGLAQWIASGDNPLTARTMVNRIWEQLFGVGLVLTVEDMGTQGEKPTHPELLDHLSWKFVHEFDWSTKTLIKYIVTSSTYKQSSEMRDELIEVDPNNQYYARMNRVRLSAEQIRDQALSVSGTLNKEMYGPPVMPYQPEGVWSSPYNARKWTLGKGDEVYRRAVYTYWKRTSPYPSMITFDGVGREFCTSRRIRTNTPLQALVTLNDTVYVDISRKMAKKVWSDNVDEMIGQAYEAAVYKPIDEDHLNSFKKLYETSIEAYRNDPAQAKLLVGDQPDMPMEELAAMTIVTNAVLNLDEVITKG